MKQKEWKPWKRRCLSKTLSSVECLEPRGLFTAGVDIALCGLKQQDQILVNRRYLPHPLPTHFVPGTYMNTWVMKDTERVKCLVYQQNSLKRSRLKPDRPMRIQLANHYVSLKKCQQVTFTVFQARKSLQFTYLIRKSIL